MSQYPVGEYSDDTLALQRALVLAGFSVGKNGSDGKMGPDTIDAIVEARDAFGLTRGPRIDIPLLVALGVRGKPLPTPPKPNPLKDWLIGLAIKQVASRLKGLPMLSGYKTYATAAVLAVMGIYSLFFGELPLVGMTVDPGSAIMALLSALGLGFGRSGAKSDVNKKLGE
jgi:peptidoglycan hydrolase-like protein with peptidoglycan-binding domain